MKITRSLISIGSITLLGLLTTAVFQKGAATTQSTTRDAEMHHDNGIADLASRSEIITMNTINKLEKQVRQLSQQQNDLMQDMEKLHLRLQANALNCPALNLPEKNTGI